ncbi:LamG-like jellyroll fold domain-containing protein [Mariniflexile sp. AS56]|uniref:LamG-like jellyroll fold domain-containing protein n=1 Tax=Mariniflexile sp. AS56 TaxID=3063957 RepID=UPI0026EE8DCE|nr:LamG-like jellyroll fold domain-containing protein [Mariniflexile sp. AS56]MDO7173638.1 LamG-like jellyroll fold domain-containing protein [Mariniflexile sp. AS56]
MCTYLLCAFLSFNAFSQTQSFIKSSTESLKLFFDSDNDGVNDDVDIDDDNDGIPDAIEETNCRLASGASKTDYKFISETFEAYPESRISFVNVSNNSEILYETQIAGTLANIPVSYSFQVMNTDDKDQNYTTTGATSTYTHRDLPNLTINFLTPDRASIIATINTGDITRCGDTFNATDHTGTYPHTADSSYNTCETSVWNQFTQQFTTSETAFIVQIVNNTTNGSVINFAIDTIQVRQSLCDTDSDGIADVFDLDSDNDGIPDVVEGNPTSAHLSEGKATLTGTSNWIDTNGNGMHDSLESILPINSDGDAIPDYLDLDSDNDGLFDIDEYGVINTNNPNFQNSDGDITGNGVGDGADTEKFRNKDSNNDGIIEGFGDGILDIFDFHQGTNYTNSYGNNSQGTAPLYALDSDADGIPDYKDPYNDVTLTFDIETVEIYANLPHTAGVLDSLVDADGDGIMASRDGDDTLFGSPRNLNGSYSLYFDGRNDYVEDTNIINSGAATLMAFIKYGGENTDTTNQIITGQDDFYIQINNNTNTITAVSEGVSLTSTSVAAQGIWMHVSLSTTSNKTTLYINGIEEASSTSGGIASTSNFTIGSSANKTHYFKGEIDEVRVFNTALTTSEIKAMVYQELDDSNGFNRGKIIPVDISTSIGSSLVNYYKMDAFKNNILDNKKTSTIDEVTGAKMYNFKNIFFQKAPLPYVTSADGDWTNTSNWLHGDEWDIAAKQDNPNDASIVHIKHNINLNGTYQTQGMTGLIVDLGKEFSIETSKGLYNSMYLKINGLIDLDNESQLIQTDGSILDIASTGKIERDQKGIKDYFTYEYWSSPVGKSNTNSNNNSYKMTDNIIKNGTIPSDPSRITFLSSGYNGSVSGTNISVADYWIWKYTNSTSKSYSYWQHVRRNGTLQAGEGFSMKGVEHTSGSLTQTQNYVFNGKPNNGDITLKINTGNDYLVGNPYPSAIDANEFIKDNMSALETNGRNTQGNVFNGTLYYWDHFAGNTHITGEYEGGYASYTLIGGVPAISNDVRINATGSLDTKTPGQYIPIAQGFFVSSILDSQLEGKSHPVVGGKLVFKNSQRAFVPEGSTASIFIKSTNTDSKQATKNVNNRQKIRLNFDSPKGYHRQLLAGVDEQATNNFDMGYDAPLIENNKEDMFWVFDDTNFTIQAVNNFNETQALALGIKINKEGIASIKIDALENIPNNSMIYLHDKELNIYHDLKDGKYDVYLPVGQYLNRFEVAFSKADALSLDTNEMDAVQVYYSNENRHVVINNPELTPIKSLEILNILGQSINSFEIKSNQSYSEYSPSYIQTGTYIIKLKTETGIVSKKVIVN